VEKPRTRTRRKVPSVQHVRRDFQQTEQQFHRFVFGTKELEFGSGGQTLTVCTLRPSPACTRETRASNRPRAAPTLFPLVGWTKSKTNQLGGPGKVTLGFDRSVVFFNLSDQPFSSLICLVGGQCFFPTDRSFFKVARPKRPSRFEITKFRLWLSQAPARNSPRHPRPAA
jgi:hypothetical protein